MKFTKLALTLLCSTMLFCACSKNSDAVIKVNDEPITKEEFYSDFNKIKKLQFKDAPKEIQADNSYAVLTLKDRYTNDIIIRKLLSQEFDKRKIEASADEIEAKKNQIIKQIGSVEEVQRMLKENGISQERFTRDMASEVKIEKLIDSLGGSKVSEKEIQNFYNSNKQSFVTPEKVQVSHILIETNPDSIKRQIADADNEAKLSSSDIDKKVAEEIKRKEALAIEVRKMAAANPKGFAELAKKYSDDKDTAEKGGDLGYITREQMVEEFGKAAFSQKVGTVSQPVKTSYGQHIILVRDKAAKGIQPYSQVKEDLKKFLVNQKKGETIQKFVEGLRTTAKIEYIDESLNPETIKKQAEDALKKQLDNEQKAQLEQEQKDKNKKETKKEDKKK